MFQAAWKRWRCDQRGAMTFESILEQKICWIPALSWYIETAILLDILRWIPAFLDCTNPRLSLRGDIAACAWRLCCVKQAAICLEIYAGDCVCILCWWSCKDYIGDHTGETVFVKAQWRLYAGELYAACDCVDIIHAVDISILRALHCMLQWTLIFFEVNPIFLAKSG